MPVYLDYQATTPLDPRVLRAMTPYLTREFANCHSTHKAGREVAQAVERARGQVASLINANPGEVVFTSGATEANNMALKGTARYYGETRPHLITSKIEHKCVLESARKLEAEGMHVLYLDVDPEGFVDTKQLEEALRANYDPETGTRTALVSVMAVNNEVGTIQDLKRIGEICAKYDTPFHTDAAQAYGKVPIDVREMGIDLLSISGHKIYGPKGVGALFLSKRGEKPARIDPLFSGGGQERGIRSGTLPVFLCVGLGAAAELAGREMEGNMAHYKSLFDLALKKFSHIPEVKVNGPTEPGKRNFGNLNLSFYGVEGESLMLAVDDKVAVSSGSACTSASLEPSHVLHAMGLDPELSHTSIRMGWGRDTTKRDVSSACDAIGSAVRHLRDISPIWDMHKAGVDTKTISWNEK